MRDRLLLRVCSALLSASALLALPARAIERTIVVLPLDVSKTEGKMSASARASLEEMLRDEAAEALAGGAWTVMTGENTNRILEDNGIDPSKCGDGSCHLTTAKEMAVEKFISGGVRWTEGTFTASIRLIDTKTGNILSATNIEADTVKGLRAVFRKQAAAFFAKAGLAADAAPPAERGSPSSAPVPASSGLGTIKVVSTPNGAKVSIDGDAAGSTPLTIKKDAGTYVVTIEQSGYAPVSRTVELAAGRAAIVNETLMQAAGYIEVSIFPDAAASNARVTVDGAVAGTGKQGPYKVGKHAVRAESSGYRAAEAAAEVENGSTTPLQLSLEALPGKLLVSVNVDAECTAGAAHAHASAGGITKLEVVAGLAHLVCSAEGHDDASAEVQVAPGKAAPVKLELARDTRPTPGKVKTEPKSGLQFVYLPAGSFHMGCEPQDAQCEDDEEPGRSASVSAFWLGKTDVTVAAYTKCVQAGACTAPSTDLETCNYGKRADHPVNCLDWNQAKTFCEWAGGRLPTAEEWEYAAKGGESRVFPWGDQPVNGRLANYCEKNCPNALNDAQKKEWNDKHWIDNGQDDGYAGTSPVGNYPAGASKWGLLDMAGNVWQWTATDYDASHKEVRGGGWRVQPLRLRASSRNGYAPSSGNYPVGFRCGL